MDNENKFYPIRPPHSFAEQSTPEALLAAVSQRLAVKNDYQLSRALCVPQALISKIRNRRTPVSPSTLVRMAEATGWTIAELRRHLGI